MIVALKPILDRKRHKQHKLHIREYKQSDVTFHVNNCGRAVYNNAYVENEMPTRTRLETQGIYFYENINHSINNYILILQKYGGSLNIEIHMKA